MLTQRQIHWLALITTVLAIAAFGYFVLGPAANILLLAFLVSYLVFPLIRWLEKKRIPRTLAVFVTLVIAVSGLGSLLFWLLPLLYWELKDFLVSSPQFFQQLIEKTRQYSEKLPFDLHLEEEEILAFARDHLTDYLQSIAAPLYNASKSILTNSITFLLGLVKVALFPLFFFYLIQHYEQLVGFLRGLIPPSKRSYCDFYLLKFNEVLSGFIRGQLSVCLALSIIYGFGFMIAGVRFGLLIGVIAGMISFIPYVGAGVGLIGSSILALVYSATWPTFLGIAIVFLVGQTLESFVITPRVVGNRVGLSPLATMLAVIAGGNFGGFLGLIFAIPLAGMLKIVLIECLKAYRNSELYH